MDNKHSVFGEVIGGLALLDKFNSWETNSLDKPLPEIKIHQTNVLENPFRESIKQIKEEKEKSEKGGLVEKPKKNEYWLTKEAEGFRLPEAKKQNKIKEENEFGLTKFLIESNQLKDKVKLQNNEHQKINKKI